MTRLLYLLLVVCALLPACSFASDFDNYTFKPDAALELGDPPRKPSRVDAGADASETEPPASQDGAPGPVDGADAGTADPADDAAQGAPDASSGPDAGDAGALIDTGSAGGLGGEWDVQLRLTSESCPGNAPLDADTWTLAELGGAAGELRSTWWTLAGVLEHEGGRAVRGTFSGFTAGIGGKRTRWELAVRLDGAELGGEMQQTTIHEDGGVGCAVRREIAGER
ncbi:MAG TPA: hypothetical protein VJN18_11110 [Polyangiaceae bacterium]|nr:hypothetical protein [Polyangiaceae bacterium]